MLTWTAPASDGVAAITHYQYRHAAGTTVPTDTRPWTDRDGRQRCGHEHRRREGVTVSSLINGTEYAFEVRAVNSAGEGTKAGPVTATPPAVACALPNFGNRRNIWSGSLTAAAFYGHRHQLRLRIWRNDRQSRRQGLHHRPGP